MDTSFVQTTFEDPDHYRNIVFPSATVLFIVATIGIAGHICIIWATCRFKHIQKPCNVLIALQAVGDLGHQMGQIPYAYLIYSGTTFVSLRSCFWIQLIPAVCTQHSIMLLVSIGLDRLFCISAPFSYLKVINHEVKRLFYLLIVNIVPLFYAGWLAMTSFVEMEKFPERETLCLIPAFFAGQAEQLWAKTTVLLAFLAVLVYVIIWTIIWRKSDVAANVRNTLKPLTIVLSLTFFGWFIGMSLVTVITMQSSFTNNERMGYSSYAGISINSAIAVNYFVYRFFGSDYKLAFKNLFKSRSRISYEENSRAKSSKTGN